MHQRKGEYDDSQRYHLSIRILQQSILIQSKVISAGFLRAIKIISFAII